jgi:signal transduction histidine kinase
VNRGAGLVAPASRILTSTPTPGDRAGIALVVALGFATTLLLLVPDLRFAVVAPQLDVAVHTAGTIVCTTAATLGFARYREQGRVEMLLEASAFLVLAAANLTNAVVALTGLDTVLDMNLAEPGQLPLYVWALARLLAAGLLLSGTIGGWTRALASERRAGAILWMPTLVWLAASAGFWLVRDWLPALLDPAALRQIADVGTVGSPLSGLNLGLFLLDGSAGLLLGAAAARYARQEPGTSGIPRAYLVTGLVLAAFSQLHFVLYPAVYTNLVSTGDVLRILFYLVLVAGIYAGSREDLQALRLANARLRYLAAAEADRSAIAERARLARELHDGLAQDLWTAQLEFGRLIADGDRVGADAGQVDRVRHALEAASDEARAAVAALRSGFDAGLSFADELPRRIAAFTDRTGFPVDIETDGSLPDLPGVLAQDVLRIVDEALQNVHKHADATRIRVRLSRAAGAMRIEIEDNGRGFTGVAGGGGHGLTGMRERAALLGGQLDVRSAPGDGTLVRFTLPDLGPPE